MTHINKYPVDPSWQVLVTDLGVRPADVLRRAGLPEDLLSREDARVTAEQYARVWRGLETEVDDPLLPLRIGDVLTTEAFQPALFAALCSPNLVVAEQRISRYKRLIAPMRLRVDDGEDALTLTFELRDVTTQPPSSSLYVTELVYAVQLARMATRERIEPVFVQTTEAVANTSEYARYFGVDVSIGDAHQVRFSAEDARRPFLTADHAMWQAFEPQLRKRLAELDTSADTSERVRAALLELLPSGRASMDTVARRLATSKRTLQRRLSKESTTFQDVLNATREELARHYLADTPHSFAEISFLLGFEDPNSFFRAFQNWTGETPGELRAMHQ